MKLIINKKYLAPLFLIVFSVLLFGLANNAFALTEIETVQYKLLPFEDQGGGSLGGGGLTPVDDGTTTTPGTGGETSGGDISYTDGSATFYFTYDGSEDLHPGYRPVDCYSVEPSGLRCDIDLGFESNITPMSCDNVWENKRTDVVVNPDEDGNVYINWRADLCDYNMPYEITGSGSVDIVGGSSTITSSGDLYCEGGMPSETNCSPSTGWETSSCPASYFCPGYGQGVSGDSTYDEGATQSVTFSRAIIKTPEVTIYGKDLIGDIDRQTGSMTVPYPTGGQNNAEIYWETQGVTVCKCTTSTGVDCTPLSGTTYSTFLGETIRAKDSPFSLTSDKTFSVDCN